MAIDGIPEVSFKTEVLSWLTLLVFNKIKATNKTEIHRIIYILEFVVFFSEFQNHGFLTQEYSHLPRNIPSSLLFPHLILLNISYSHSVLYRYNRMYRWFTDAILLRSLAHRCIVVYDISRNFHCPFLDITFHSNPRIVCFFTIYAGRIWCMSTVTPYNSKIIR